MRLLCCRQPSLHSTTLYWRTALLCKRASLFIPRTSSHIAIRMISECNSRYMACTTSFAFKRTRHRFLVSTQGLFPLCRCKHRPIPKQRRSTYRSLDVLEALSPAAMEGNELVSPAVGRDQLRAIECCDNPSIKS